MKYKTRFFLFFTAMTLFHLAASFAHPVTTTIIQELHLPVYHCLCLMLEDRFFGKE